MFPTLTHCLYKYARHKASGLPSTGNSCIIRLSEPLCSVNVDQGLGYDNLALCLKKTGKVEALLSLQWFLMFVPERYRKQIS